MNDCNHYQTLLLEHLYGLLDDADGRALQDHLASCPSCQGALDQAKRQQRLLAAAAKDEFPAVRFEAPAEEAAPEVVPLPEPVAMPRRTRHWGRWAVAAALLLAAGGLCVPAAWYGHDYLQARDVVRAHDDEVADAQKAAGAVAGQLRQLPVERDQKVDEVWKAARDRQINLVVSGPQRVEVGAPSEFRIETRNLDGKPVLARLDVSVVDQNTGKTVLEEKGVKTAGEYQLKLQPNLPLRPDTALALVVNAHREGDDDAESSLRERLELAAPVYVTHLATDRPMYQVGDVLHFRSLTLERFSLKPPPDDFRLVYTLAHGNTKTDILSGSSRLLAGEGKPEMTGPDGKALRGIGSGEYLLEGPEGGEYTLTVHEANNRFPPQERKFIVNRYQPSALNKELNFDRSSYGAGETVVARLKVTRTNGEPAAHCLATPAILIDGKAFGIDGLPKTKAVSPFIADESGKVDVAFKLPREIERGQASLSVLLQDVKVPDTIVRTIPLVLKSLQVDFYPEGGDLVAGAENRVYFQVRTSLDKPGDLHGQIVDDRDNVIVDDIQTLTDAEVPGVNQGMGVFSFRPDSMRKYQLKIDAPLGVTSKHELPAAKMDAVTLKVLDGVTGPSDLIRVQVCSPMADRALLVGAYCRGRLLDHQMVTAKQGQCAEVALKPSSGAGGVYRITVFEDLAPPEAARRQLVPRAERLVYRQPAESLKLAVTSDKPQYIPGDRVTLTVTARDEQDHPTGAVVLLSVVDKRTLTMADEKTARAMPTHFLLTTEVRKPEDLEHADFLLTADPKAHLALDLLLGTQGWRRFAEQNPGQFKERLRKDQRLREDAERLLVTIGQSSPKVTDYAKEEAKKVAEEFDGRDQELRSEHDKAIAVVVKVQGDDLAAAARARMQRYDDWLDHYGRPAAPVAGLLLFVLLLVALLVTLPRSAIRSASFAVGVVAGGLVLLILSFVPLVSRLGRERQEAQMARADAAGHQWFEDKAMERNAAPLMAPRVGAMPPAPPPPMAANAMLGGGEMEGAQLPPMAPGMARKGEDKGKADAPGQDGDMLKRAENLDRAAGFALADGKKQNRGLEQEQAEKQALQLREMPKARGGFGGGGGRGGAMPGGGGRPGKPGDFGLPFGDRRFAPQEPPLPPLIVREYAHKNESAPGDLRKDFAETLLWQPALVVSVDGSKTVSFDLCDSVTTFEVAAAGHTLNGRLGTTTGAVASRLPFTLEPKTPIEVSSADRIDLPVTVTNNTTDNRAVTLKAMATGLDLEGKADDSLTVAGHSAARRLYRFHPNTVEGEARVEFRGETVPFAADRIARTFRIVPDGFPVVGSKSDLLEGSASNDVVLPETWVKGTLKCRVQVYPSTLASLQKGLEAMLREPNGCFEQTSTSNYPNLLILDYLKESDQARPEVEARARDLLQRGYQKLTSFECPKTSANSKQGYEWFGAPDGAHEALTAYGLLQFRDMARVQPVDAEMLKRTQQYLLASRDGKGGFTRNARALDTFGRAPEQITNAYIVWSLTESGKDDDVTKELDALHDQAKTSKDPYFLSLVANSLLNRDRSADAVALLKTVASLQKEDGHLDAERTSITGSGGRDLQIETTGLAVLGWLKANRPADFTLAVEKSVKWIGQQRGGYGGFGSTQSTILALKALIAHARANKKTPEAGELTLSVGDVRVGQQEFPAGTQDVLTVEMPDPEKYLKPGSNPVRVRITGKNNFPYTLTWSYQTLKPVSAEGCAVRLATKLDRETANEGEAVHLTVTLENLKEQGQGMAVAIIGLPAGLSLPEDLKQLKEHARLRENDTKPGLISTFETRSRELILYWRDLAPGQKIEVPIDLVCRVPGDYRGPASRAYLYYNSDVKHWVEPLSVKVAAKE
jgi:alpha-2-macroglobulin-like protein